ncbi:MAG: Cytoplasmic polyadenylation element-binding protein 1 [Paramarteilia canceri]
MVFDNKIDAKNTNNSSKNSKSVMEKPYDTEISVKALQQPKNTPNNRNFNECTKKISQPNTLPFGNDRFRKFGQLNYSKNHESLREKTFFPCTSISSSSGIDTNISSSFENKTTPAIKTDWRIIGEKSFKKIDQNSSTDSSALSLKNSSILSSQWSKAFNEDTSLSKINGDLDQLIGSTPKYKPKIVHENLDVLKQVMDMQVKVHKTTAQSNKYRQAMVWEGKAHDGMQVNTINRTKECVQYSKKVFAGGVPWEATEKSIMDAFSNLKSTNSHLNIAIEYPNKLNRMETGNSIANYFPGYFYLIFENGEKVAEALEKCCKNVVSKNNAERYFFEIKVKNSKISSESEPERRPTTKKIQFIPFKISDSEWINYSYTNIENMMENTIFVGALHGQLTANLLAKIMQDLFGEVLRVSIDLDKSKYPIGSGKVTFVDASCLNKALDAGLVDIITEKFQKRIQIDPYLKISGCCMCHSISNPTYFCRDTNCYAYFCKDCWFWRHNAPSGNVQNDLELRNHIPLTR